MYVCLFVQWKIINNLDDWILNYLRWCSPLLWFYFLGELNISLFYVIVGLVFQKEIAPPLQKKSLLWDKKRFVTLHAGVYFRNKMNKDTFWTFQLVCYALIWALWATTTENGSGWTLIFQIHLNYVVDNRCRIIYLQYISTK